MKNKPHNPHPVAAFRRRAAITQEQLAVLLGCSVSKVKQVETGRRQFNEEESTKLSALELLYKEKGSIAEEEIPAAAKELYSSMDNKIADDAKYDDLRNRHLTRKYTRQLAKMVSDSAGIHTLLHIIDQFRQIGLEQTDAGARRLIMQEPKLLLKLKSCCSHVQDKLRNKIALLRAEAMTNKNLHRGK